jgi:hypothetical protein
MPAAKPINTAFAKELKELFEDDLKKKQAARRKENKEKKKAAKQKGEEHVASDEPLKGVLAKDGKYAQNGHDYLKSVNGRGVYQNVDHPYFAHIKDLVADRCKFPDAKQPDNFNPASQYKQKRPYPWQAHHILPGEAFYCELSSGPIFTPEQIELILKSDYNINDGHNIMMMPALNRHVCVHRLMQHAGSHNKYSVMVMKGLKKLSDKLKKIVDQKKEHEDVTANVAEELRKMEDAYWNWLVKVSRSVVTKMAGSIQYEYDPIKFKTASSNRRWGSLA